ncbi:M23 family metallopeptidase [Thalassomonas viridans]|uniref:M23 family metallopeptidase n=1 Tax=Thalassomonas viridans TaxID=137584 RepID=A0AAE9Z7K2_9GAMM|nr:M23 family metallopeptidase [Thalassomonas viridans]WDE07983.1 M23 family metallopeptidase [Thalassomonas viridans]
MSKKLLAGICLSSCLSLFVLGISAGIPAQVSAHGKAHKQVEVQLFGEVLQGGMVVGKTSANNTVKLDEQELQLSPQGEFVFGFGRDDSKEYRLQVISPGGEVKEQLLTPAKREYKIQRIEGIKKSIMQPNPEAVARSKKDNAQIAKARKTASELTSFAGGFIAPIQGTITGVYGSQRVFNGVPKRPHFGLDYAGDVGDPVKAPAAGKVLLYVPDMFYSGGTMIIDHGQGITSTFLHLSDAYVKAGDEVKQGQVVAAVGKSGRATGPHLDWRINWFNVRLDPALALKVRPL